MRAKQVTALMMAATLAVTGNGVTAFAEPVANVEAGDAATEALNVETTEEVETAAEVEVTEDSEDVTKSAQQDASSDITVETKTSATTVKAGATVTVTTTVKGDKLTNGTLTVKSYELIATKSAVDTTIATSADGTFVFAPEKDTTYKVKAVFTHASEKNEYYAEKALDAFTIEAASIATNRLHVPEVTTISNKDGAALNTTAAPEVTAALETANKLDEAYGKWTVKDEAVTTATKEIVFTFTATDGVYTIDNSDTAAVETDKTYEKTVSVKVVQLATGVSIEDENGPISTTVEMATTDKKALTAKVAAGSGSDTVSNAKVTWTSSDSSKVKVTATGDNEAVITAVSKTEAGKEVTITATTTDGTQKVGEIKVAVKEGINADSISFDSKLPEITYEGAGDLEDYYKDYVAALNKKTTIGTYSIKDTSETIDSVGGVDKTSTVASLKTNTENSQTIKNGLTIVFTLSDDAGLTPVDGKTKWDTKTVEKTYDVVINRAVINRDASAVTGKLESSYAAGAKLSEILAGKNVTEFDIEVQKKVDGAWKTIADKDLENEIPNIGTLANYQVKYSLKDSAKTVYTLSGADANGYKYVSLSGISITQPVLTDVKAENVSEKLTADKFKDGDTLKLKASYNEKKLGSANYTTSYQWYKLNEKTNKYVAISTTDNPTADKATLEVSKIADIPGTYYCEITADVNGSVKNFLPDATDAQVEAYSKLVKSTNKVTVEATKITVDTTTSGLGLSKTEATYGATADVKAIAKVTADDVSAYRVYYKQVTTVANKPSLGEAKDITKKSVNEDEAFLFKSGRTISESLGNLDAGTYRIYLEVTAGKETTSYEIGDIKVAQKEITGLNSKNLKVEDATYGQKLSDAKIIYNDTEIDAALDFAFVDNTVADAGSYTSKEVAVSVVDPNYTTDTKVTLKANVNVAKAPLSVTAKDVTIEQGQEAALDGTVKGLVGKDTAKVTYAVLGTDGKAVQSTKNLAVGTYKIRATVEDQKNYDVTSVVDGTLTVNAVAATGVTVNTTALKINVGESRQVSATVAPANAADKNVTWSSDNTAVAKVTSDGVVYAIAEGTANVTAKTANGKTATIAVTVSTVKADSVKLSASKVTLTSIGASKTVKATVNPTNTTDKTVTWSSSNKKVATVDKNGKIVAKGNGKATITVKTANGKKATVKVTVKQATKKVVLKVGKKVVTGKTYTLKEGKKATVKATVTDAKGKKVTSGNQKIKWTTSNKKVATISKSGKITAKKAGTVKITAKTADGKKVTFKVKVK